MFGFMNSRFCSKRILILKQVTDSTSKAAVAVYCVYGSNYIDHCIVMCFFLALVLSDPFCDTICLPLSLAGAKVVMMTKLQRRRSNRLFYNISALPGKGPGSDDENECPRSSKNEGRRDNSIT